MASPIPTQLSPGVNVSEVDLSQFIQPESLNSGGMVGIFNWGPGYEKNRISTESQLAEIYGKPTLDQSDVAGNSDFLSAANFLKYSNNLSVIRALQSTDSNATSDEAGITNINSCQYRTISNFEEFKRLGELSADSQGIEPIAHFRARYPGNFGDSLRVYVSDGNTSGSTTTTETTIEYQGVYDDFNIKGGYQGSMIVGITSGICGLTIGTFVEEMVSNEDGTERREIRLSFGGITGGLTFVNIPYYIVTFQPPVPPSVFCGLVSGSNYLTSTTQTESYDRFAFLYATGTTTENYTLMGGGQNPDGNVANVFPLGYFSGADTAPQANPISLFAPNDFTGIMHLNGVDPIKLMRINPVNDAFVDMIFMNFDKHSIGFDSRYDVPNTWEDDNPDDPVRFLDGQGKTKLFVDVIDASGIPPHFRTTQEFDFGIGPRRLFFSGYTIINDAGQVSVNGWFNMSAIQDPTKRYDARFTPMGFHLDFAHKMYGLMTGNTASPTPTGTVRGLATLIGLTGGHTFRHYTTIGETGSMVEKHVNFGTEGGITGIRNNFKYGIVQFGQKANVQGTIINSNGESTSTTASSSGFVFEKQPGTSPYAASLGGSNDEINIAIVDAAGKFGPKNSILERFELLSKAVDAKNADNQSIYYKDYINNNSKYLYMTRAFDLVGGNGDYASRADTAFGDITYQYLGADGVTFTKNSNYDTTLLYGESGTTAPSIEELSKAYSMFADDDNAVDVLFIPELYMDISSESSDTTLESSVYDNVINRRKDTILILPTPKPTINQHPSLVANNAISFRKSTLTIPSNSYTVLVTGRKVFFDTFNNQLRKMSLSSDVAGILCAQEIPWESPAGFSRGFIRNAVKLETNFSKSDRDELYKNGINFFVQFNDGSGTVLYSDKTMLTKPSAFDRINVRRVFIALEKAIAKAAKYSLFEFNDEFTRSQFRNLVTPFLSSVQAQRGIADFKVICDETNNTSQVIDNNQFVADIYIKPLKSINFIQLNFVAVKSDFNLTTTE
jgi:hypothetical protein